MCTLASRNSLSAGSSRKSFRLGSSLIVPRAVRTPGSHEQRSRWALAPRTLLCELAVGDSGSTLRRSRATSSTAVGTRWRAGGGLVDGQGGGRRLYQS